MQEKPVLIPARPSDYNQFAGQKIQRIEALADGVFAIALTLLVLDLRIPFSQAIQTEGDVWQQLLSISPKLVTYFLSFVTLGIFWTAHSTEYTYITKSDRHLSWLSIFYLMVVSLVPFTTAFLSDHISFKLAIGLYWFNIFLLGLTIFLHWTYAYRNDFLSPDIPDKPALGQAIRRRIITAQLLYAGAALLCFINNYLSIAVIIIIQLNYALALRFSRKS